MLRILIAGFGMANTKIIGMIKSHFSLFFERHNPSQLSKETVSMHLCPFSYLSYDVMIPLFGYIHESFMKIKADNFLDNQEGINQHPIISLYFNLLKMCWSVLEKYNVINSELKVDWNIWDKESTQFLQFCNSPTWGEIYDTHFSPSVKKDQIDSFKNLESKAKQLSRGINLVIKKLRKDIAEEERESKRLNEEINNATLNEAEVEKNRITGMEIERKSVQYKVNKLWLIKLQEMTREQGAWIGFNNEIQTHWKLDFTENYSRMRRRLTFNHEYKSHQDASAKRDRILIKGDKSFPKWKRSSIANYLNRATSRSERIKEHINTIDSTSDKKGHSDEYTLLTEDASEDPDWDVIYDKDYRNGNSLEASKEEPLIELDCGIVFLLASIQGKLRLTASTLSFIIDRNWIIEELNNPHSTAVIDWDIIRDRKWNLNEIREIHYRKHMLRQSALEIFFMDQTSYFFNFENSEKRNRMYNSLKQQPLPSLIRSYVSTPSETLKRLNLTQRWQRHEISNFEYLMQLNSIAGRSYNDLTQYFVFPWILSDYTSDKINLNDPSIYRDLSKPIGAIDPQRLKQSIEMYNEFEDPNGIIKKFHYGTHYSSAGSVAFYLIRIEPFTSIHIALQSGKFDHADRQFISLESCWKSCLKGVGDVKELIPEFFYLPEFLKNSNNFDLGRTQSGILVDDVKLPPWANNPEHFIQLHREALESEFVSQNIHLWIDLIFGYKQTGEEAIKAFNTFYYLTYEGAIDLDSITDTMEKRSIEEQIYYFGQTPLKIFITPHPQRYPHPATNIPARIYDQDPLKLLGTAVKGITHIFKFRSERFSYITVTPSQSISKSRQSTSSSLSNAIRYIISVDRLGTLGYHRILVNSSSCTVNLEGSAPFSLGDNPTTKCSFIIPSPFAHGQKLTSKNFLISHDGQYLISSGHWDNTIKLIDITNEKIVASVGGHGDIITCISKSEDNKLFVTGSRDSSVFSWNFEDFNGSNGTKSTAPGLLKRRQTRVRSSSNEGTSFRQKILQNSDSASNNFPFSNNTKPDLAFYGHNDVVTCSSINFEHDLLVSGSKDGTCILHSLKSGLFLRSLSPHPTTTSNVCIHFVLINSDSLISVISEVQKTNYLHVYTINGTLLNFVELQNTINDVKLSPDQRYLFVIDNSAQFEIYHIFSLKCVLSWKLPLVPYCLCYEEELDLFLMGCSDGKLLSLKLQ